MTSWFSMQYAYATLGHVHCSIVVWNCATQVGNRTDKKNPVARNLGKFTSLNYNFNLHKVQKRIPQTLRFHNMFCHRGFQLRCVYILLYFWSLPFLLVFVKYQLALEVDKCLLGPQKRKRQKGSGGHPSILHFYLFPRSISVIHLCYILAEFNFILFYLNQSQTSEAHCLLV